MFYASQRPDLDESLLLDCLQDRYQAVKQKGVIRRELVQAGCYRNDRQVRSKVVDHFIDRHNPRVEIRIEALAMQQGALELTEQADDPLAMT